MRIIPVEIREKNIEQSVTFDPFNGKFVYDDVSGDRNPKQVEFITLSTTSCFHVIRLISRNRPRLAVYAIAARRERQSGASRSERGVRDAKVRGKDRDSAAHSSFLILSPWRFGLART